MITSSTQNLILVEGAATYERILEAVRDSETDEGILYIKDFLKIYPEFAKAHNDLAVLYYQAGNALKALAHHEKAHKLDSRNSTYRKNLADFYFAELEWVGEAVGIYSDILKDDPLDTEALNSLGAINLHLGRREKARSFFKKTLQIDVANPDALTALQQLPPPPIPAETTRQLPQTPALSPIALEPAQNTPCCWPPIPQKTSFQGQSATTKLPEDLYLEATELIAISKLPEAITVLEALVCQDANHALAHNDLGVLYQRAGDSQKSRFHHEEAVRLQPNNTTFQKNLADLLITEFYAIEEALRIYVHLLSENSSDVEVLKAITHICLAMGNHDDARHFLRQILTIKPWDMEASETLRGLISTGNENS